MFKKTALNALMLNAAKDRAEAMTSLEIMLEHPCGVGDHSTDDFYNNLNQALNKLENAESRIECIKRNFADDLPIQEV